MSQASLFENQFFYVIGDKDFVSAISKKECCKMASILQRSNAKQHINKPPKNSGINGIEWGSGADPALHSSKS